MLFSIPLREGFRSQLGCMLIGIPTVALTQLKRSPPGFNCVNLGKIRHWLCLRVQQSVVRCGWQLTAMQSWLANVAKWPGAPGQRPPRDRRSTFAPVLKSIPPEVPPVVFHQSSRECADGTHPLLDNVAAIGVLLAGQIEGFSPGRRFSSNTNIDDVMTQSHQFGTVPVSPRSESRHVIFRRRAAVPVSPTQVGWNRGPVIGG